MLPAYDIKAFLAASAVGAALLVNSMLICKGKKNPTAFMDKKESGVIYLWGVSHLVMHAAIVYWQPESWLTMLALGVAWEALEEYTAQVPVPGVSKCNDKHLVWWYSKVGDIAYNALGVLLGLYLAGRLFPTVPAVSWRSVAFASLLLVLSGATLRAAASRRAQ